MDDAEFFRRLFVETPDGVLYSDCDGIIRFWNAGCQRIFGFSQDEAVGQSLDLIIPAGLRQRHWQGYANTVRTGQTRYGGGDVLSVPALRKDAVRISVEFSIIPFLEAGRMGGQMVGMAAIMRDVTSRFEELKDLRRALAASKAG